MQRLTDEDFQNGDWAGHSVGVPLSNREDEDAIYEDMCKTLTQEWVDQRIEQNAFFYLVTYNDWEDYWQAFVVHPKEV